MSVQILQFNTNYFIIFITIIKKYSQNIVTSLFASNTIYSLFTVYKIFFKYLPTSFFFLILITFYLKCLQGNVLRNISTKMY